MYNTENEWITAVLNNWDHLSNIMLEQNKSYKNTHDSVYTKFKNMKNEVILFLRMEI